MTSEETSLESIVPPAPRARTTEDQPLPLRDQNHNPFEDALPPEAFECGSVPASNAAPRTSTATRPGAWVIAPLNFNAKRVPFAPFDEAADGKLGSVYTRLTETLLARGDWDRKAALRNKATGEMKLPSNYGLLLGTAQGKGVPWGRLGYGVWPPPLVNYMRGFDSLTRKGKMQATLETAKAESGGEWPTGMPARLTEGAAVRDADPWTLAPTSFVFHPSKGDANPTAALREAYAARAAVAAASASAGDETSAEARQKANRWILKPSEGAKGEGIFIEETLEAIEGHLEAQVSRAAEGEAVSSWVVQAYIHNPLLLKAGGRKFDMRCWVLVDAHYGVHLYRHGVLRVASAAYDENNVTDRFAHLTNHCIATEHAEYGKFEPTNELFYRAFDAELAERYPELATAAKGVGLFGSPTDAASDCGSVLETVVLPQVRRHIVQSLLAARERLEGDGDYYQPFQLYGYDFLLDDDLRVWLCEINASPAVADELLPGLVDALVRTAIDPICPPNDELLVGGRKAYDAAAVAAESADRRECFECILDGRPVATDE